VYTVYLGLVKMLIDENMHAGLARLSTPK